MTAVIPIAVEGDEPTPPARPEQPAEPENGGATRAVSTWFARQPLRARLVATIAALLAIGLAATALVTQTIVSHYLVSQVDRQLTRTVGSGSAIVRAFSDAGPGPSEYSVVLRDATGASEAYAWPAAVAQYGQPDIPQMTQESVNARGGAPFTVHAKGGTQNAQWRVVAVNVVLPSGEPGIAFVALPLEGAHDVSRILERALLGTGVGIILLGAGAAWLLVRRSLRPLQEIETTAAAIAGGDLTQRVPAAPPTTEVGSLGASLNAMLAQIEHAFSVREESERRMRQFVSDASHELRTPLATIRGYGELYRMGALDSGDKVEDTMGRMEDAARRMGTLVNDLLELARMDEGRPMRKERVDLVAMAADAAQDLRALDPSRAVTVAGLGATDPAAPGAPASGAPVPAPPPSLVVTGDGDRLRQVLTNLVGNVARHTPAGTPAQIALGIAPDPARPGRRTAMLEVRDHGAGVTPEQAARMFERFYRADSSRNRGSGGSGLGLAIVAAIIGAHGGHIETVSPPGGGLVVRVRLPLAGEPPEPATADVLH